MKLILRDDGFWLHCESGKRTALVHVPTPKGPIAHKVLLEVAAKHAALSRRRRA